MAFVTLSNFLTEPVTAIKLQTLSNAIAELRPLFVEKTLDQTLNNSAVLQNDTALFLAVPANTKWELNGVIRFNSGTTPDFRAKFTVPALATLKWNIFAQATTWLGFQQDETTTAVIDGLAASVAAQINGVLTVGANAGNLQLQWAQGTANVSNTIVQIGSYLKLQRMS